MSKKYDLISIDPGLTGGLAMFSDGKLINTVKMPIIRFVVKEAILVMNLDPKTKKKRFYKTGPKKGEVIMKVKTPQKTKDIIDAKLLSMYFKDADFIVVEVQNPRPGNSAGASFTTGTNYGRLLAAIEISDKSPLFVTPANWKKDMHITMSKDEKSVLGNNAKLITRTLKAKAISLGQHLFKKSFRTRRGALMDGECEAAIIGHWYLEKQKKG